ncbi:CHAT domain-containing protein [Cellulosimicrobium arenosum]|uniref:CHAT domain-containing protein n=1 Tax=Cellulosimicrobium arenosum TaxID=2708133 RepID=A0A927J251_9MICO|nr:CHAT domain-containing tetratricopeptide repeat protein [Cellulosimicrobium arenosum]MBD8080541.1 CHAT domain-containing protein [Cellulosimicrobium arenosum]
MFTDRLRAAQELNALARVRPAHTAFRALVRDVERWERSAGATDWSCELRVRALVGAAACVYALRGSVGAGNQVLDRAEAIALEVGDPRLRSSVHGQRGLLLLRSGDGQAALRELTAALDEADETNQRDMTLLRLNRGSAYVDGGQIDAALRDFEAALHHARVLGNDYYASFALHNIGYAHYAQGDMPAALRFMDESVALLPDGADGMALVGRARVLFEVGLLNEAERALEEAESLLDDEGLGLERAESLLDRARCLVGLRRFDEAREVAVQARRLYQRSGNPTWCLYARVVELEAMLGADRSETDTVSEARRRARRRSGLALKVALAGDERGVIARFGVSVPARLYAAEWSLLGGETDAAREILGAVRRLPAWAPFPVRVQHHAVRAQLAFADGDRRDGVRSVRRGQQAIAEHRARLGSVDAVTATAVHAVRLGNVDVSAALWTRRPAAVFDAVERGRAAFAGSGRIRPPSDPAHAGLLTRARREVEAARDIGSAADGELQLERQQHLREARRLQEEARRRSWLDSGEVAVPVATTERALRAALADTGSSTVVADLLVDGGAVTAVRVGGRGSRLRRLASLEQVSEHVRRARADFAVLSNALIPVPMREAALGSLQRTLAWLDDTLIAPLEAEGDLHLAARNVLLGVPWAALPSRRGLRTWANSWIDLRQGQPQRRTDHALVVGGPGLRFSSAEARLVAGAWQSAALLTGASATCAAVVDGLDGAGVVHLAAHGAHETDNPLFSSIRLTDGPLFAHELDGIDLNGVVVVLSACEVGLSTPRIGGESLGLTSVLLRLGARAVIASVAPLRDDVAARVMPALHAELRGGAMPGVALARAVIDEPEPVPLVCFGPLVL